MKDAIHCGAQEIIVNGDQVINEQSVEDIIQKSRNKTDEFQKELNSIEQRFNLNDMNDKNNMYVFEGENYKQKGKPEEVKVQQFIEIKRQKVQKPGQYDIDKYYQKAFYSNTAVKEKKKHKGWRAIVNGGYDHQFFNIEELDKLEEKENANLEDPSKPALTDAEQKKKDKLLKDGFSNWGKKEFFHFINLCE